MKNSVRFVPVEVVSKVTITNGRNNMATFRVVSYLLIPSFSSGKPVISDYIIPEVYLQ
jgi:hypothetical protein